ncbi:MAG: hypothetical protein Fur0037_14120 [Planctomycetota bacterium]
MRSPSARPPVRFALMVFLLGAVLAGCQSAENLLFRQKPDDPNDGYNSLPEAGVNTVMDWGPGQELLLKDYTNLKEQQARMQKRIDELVAENQNLKAQLAKESESVAREKGLRQQADSHAESLQKRTRELEAKVLSLSIEKAKLEQANLLAEIERLQKSLETAGAPAEASAPGDR